MSERNSNAAIYFVDRHLDTDYAEKPVFIETDGGKRTLVYRELAEESAKIPDLYKRHGIRREDRVALLLLDQIEFPILFWGSLKAGVVPIALNTLLSTDVYSSILNDSRPRALFVSEALLPLVEPLLPDHPHIEAVFVAGPGNGTYFSLVSEVEKCSQSGTLEVSADECAFWLYSSGSTGQPKGVRHTHASLGHTADTYGSQVLDIKHADVVYSAAKFFFAYGLGNAMTFPMSVGATTLLLAGRPTPDSVMDILTEHGPTMFFGVPTLYAATIAKVESEKTPLDLNLRRCVSAGEALPADIGNNWEQLTGCEILDGVGSTEMLHIFLSNLPGDVIYGTAGIAVPGYEVRLVDESGHDTKRGEVGELLVKGDSAATDYWNQREKSRSTFEGVWTRTGDKYERRDDDRFVYCGRTDDMFKVSGIWVSPFEVEQALIGHRDVLEAAVVAQRDDDQLEKPKAFVVLKNNNAGDDIADQLKEHVKERIGKWKYPRWVEIVAELPKTPTGKIQRFKLRDQ